MSLEIREEFELHGTKRKHDGSVTRRRASLACDTCRKQKEKCEGGLPCWRCQRLGRPCRFQEPAATKKTSTKSVDPSTNLNSEKRDQHIQNLEQIVQHFLGDVPLDEENIGRIAAKCSSNNRNDKESLLKVNESFDVQFVSGNVAFYSGEFSHWNFAEKLRRTTRSDRDSANVGVKEYWRPTHLQSSTHIVAEAISQLPPRPIAEFLIGVFFRYEELNSFYLEKSWIQDKLALCYNPTTVYTVNDIPWVCTFFAVLAIGTQMAHMEDDSHDPSSQGLEELSDCSEDSVGLVFYHVASKLVPDVFLAASYESVQAFLLLAAWALPISTGGLSYTYFGLSMKMAIQNGMHRKYVGNDCDGRIIELRNRLFWTVYTLEMRTSILHGRPCSLARSDINADLPKQHPAFQSPNFTNMMAFIKLVTWMGEVADTLAQFKRCPRRLLVEYSDRLLQLKTSIKEWWDSLPTKIECRDYDPQGPLFRQNSHMKLCYLLIYIYMGRPFIFRNEDSESRSSDNDPSNPRSELVSDCVQSALDILAALQSLSDTIGLCRASYTEFSSCRAAILVILAESLNLGRSSNLQSSLGQGMVLIRQMLGGTASQSEISYIESIEAAIRQLSSNDNETDSTTANPAQGSTSAYAKFKDWTQSMKKDRRTSNNLELASFSPMSHMVAGGESVLQPDNNDLSGLFNADWAICDLGLNLNDFPGS
ncbi:uncharacterized protein N7496_009174 [Penicillium cataractarum]|uniref:Zn(2)-C6 fungal-type domain-containing protein n=1 Tax=Penicillium cataractarum TaxID=2100454 RepID=A0A9W9V276_9EURO|nr:uncharacterized protein N7496_009174 [Penicillium cataractarum]KAJ5363461.1 hypothetical protein N7496_009174 [Penicillium cataractarum]